MYSTPSVVIRRATPHGRLRRGSNHVLFSDLTLTFLGWGMRRGEIHHFLMRFREENFVHPETRWLLILIMEPLEVPDSSVIRVGTRDLNQLILILWVHSVGERVHYD